MANIKSAVKRARQSEENRIKNRAEMQRVRTTKRALLAAVEAGDKEKSKAGYRAFCSVLDKALKHGVMKANTVSRQKSRLSARLAKMA